jgi:hypothetical protein
MRHHLVLYGPLHKQRSDEYIDATLGRPSLGNIGLEWLIPAALMITAIALLFNVVHVSIGYQLLSFGTMLAWSFVMFSFMHDAMHVDGFWMEKNRWLRHWFLAARRLRDIHPWQLNDSGLCSLLLKAQTSEDQIGDGAYGPVQNTRTE